jgi:hypothetical protein
MEEPTDLDHVCASQLSHFEHADEVMRLLLVIVQDTSNIKEASNALERLTAIVRKFFFFLGKKYFYFNAKQYSLIITKNNLIYLILTSKR